LKNIARKKMRDFVLLFFTMIIVIMVFMQAIHLLRVRRVQKRLSRLRKRLVTIVTKANPESFDRRGRLGPGCFPARIPPEAEDLHGQMRRTEFQLAMIRLQAECRHRELRTEQNSSLKDCDTEPCCSTPEQHDRSARTSQTALVIL
jgi:hypothetical protein